VKDVHRRAAIHYGASSGYLGVVQVIVDRGGDPEVLDERGSTPLERAQERGHLDVVMFLKGRRFMKKREEDQYLPSNGCEIILTTQTGCNCLHLLQNQRSA
jgi:ankyrin repeat protein